MVQTGTQQSGENTMIGFWGPWYVESPAADTDLPGLFVFHPVEIVEIFTWTDTGTVDFNIEIRSDPDAAGTNILTADVQATSSGVSSTAFAVSEVDGRNWLAVAASAIASSPTKLWIAFDVIPVDR